MLDILLEIEFEDTACSQRGLPCECGGCMQEIAYCPGSYWSEAETTYCCIICGEEKIIFGE